MESSQKTMKAVLVEDFKKPLKYADVPVPTINDNQVLIKQSYAPINPSDMGSVKGHYFATQKIPPPFTAGFEGSGTIAEIGKNFESKFKVGDRVYFLNLGSWAEYLAVDGDATHKLPDDAPIDVAACSFVNPMTVYLMLLELQAEGHKSVVHTAGSSALGRMFIKVMKDHGIKTINLVRNADYIPELKEIGADYVFNTTDANFDKDFKEACAKEGTKRAYDALCGTFTGKLVWLMPKKSSIKVYGALSNDPTTHVDFWALVSQDSTVGGFWLSSKVNEYPPEVIAKGFQLIFAGLKGSYASTIQKVFKFEEAEEAIKYAGENASKGKILLSLDGK